MHPPPPKITCGFLIQPWYSVLEFVYITSQLCHSSVVYPVIRKNPGPPLYYFIFIYFQAGARRWLKDTNCKLRMFVDPERHLYNTLGLKRSVAKTWSIPSLVYYAEQKQAGRKLAAMFEEDDPNQMGGDFILDEQGRLALIHRSRMSTDRPPVEELLSCVRDLNRAKANL